MSSACLRRAASALAMTLVGALFSLPASASTPPLYDALLFDGAINDGIANGAVYDLTAPDYQPSVALDPATGALTVTDVQASTGSTIGQRVLLAPPSGQTSFTVGTAYDTTKTPGAGTAELDARIGATQCTASTGHLVINRLDVDGTTGQVTAFAATFDQTCTGRTGTLFGDIRMHAPEGYRAAKVAPLGLSFGNVPVGGASSPQTVTMTALPGDPLVTAAASVHGTNADNFAVSADNCAAEAPDAVTPGVSCTVSVTASPTAPGTRTAVLWVPDGTARGHRLVNLTASGVVPPGAPGGLTARQAADGIALSWTWPTDTGGAPVTKFSVFRGDTAASLTWLADTSSASYADTISPTTLSAHDYVYAVSAVNIAGTGPQSDPASARTPDAVTTSSTAPSVLTLDGALGSYVAGGRSLAFVGGVSGDKVTLIADPGRVSITGQDQTMTHFSSASFAAPSGQTLVPGTTYTGAQSAPQAGQPMISVASDGSGCSGVGQFTVLEAVYSASGAPVRVAIDYEFHCYDMTTPRVVGSVRFGSDVGWTGVRVDVPTTPAPVGAATQEVEHVRNVGTQPVTLGAAALHAGPSYDPDTSADWSLVSDGCNGVTLNSGESCDVTLSVTASATGPREVGLLVPADTPLGGIDRYLSVMGAVPPPAPSYLNPTTASGGGVQLQWSIDQDYRAPITSWEVLRGTTADDLVVVHTVDRATSGPSWTDPDTTPGFRMYAVRAVNVAGAGPITSVALTYGPGAPVATTPVSLARAVGVSWHPPATMDSRAVTYRVYAGPTADSLTPAGTTAGTSYVVPGVAPGTTFYLAVAALYDGTTEGPRSDVVSVTAGNSQLVEADLDGVLRVHSTDGGPGIALSDGFAVHDTPAVSPNGELLAYTAGSSIYLPGHITIRPVDGSSAAVQLTSSSYHDDSPVFTPDGARIYFVRWTNGTPSIHSVLAAGGGETTLPNSNQLFDPTITPDGSALIATDGSSAAAPLARIALRDGTYAKTSIPGTAYASDPSVSPDGRRLSFVNASGVVQVIPVAGGTPTTVPTPPGAMNTSWSTDGKWIYASATNANGSSDLWKLHADGQGWPTMITGNDLVDEGWVTTDTIDTTAPTVTTARLAPAKLAGQVNVSWSGTDVLNPVTSYDVQVRRVASDGTDFGWQTVVTATSGTSAVVSLSADTQTCVEVRARDRAGNQSGWSPMQCTIRPMDDSVMAASAGTLRAKGSAYYFRTVTRTTTKGAWVSRGGMRGRRFVVVATTCPTCGSVEVLVGSHWIGSLSLHSSTIRHRVVLRLPLQSSTLRGTLRVRATTSGKLVEIDGAGVGLQ
ncbi:MAG TPA: choice-of-anchor D domain-containing protein [Mycobacteriales bacterium]|nr:choice-of-anchor D domain-containing protein [Mycobacteriales bacterium]